MVFGLGTEAKGRTAFYDPRAVVGNREPISSNWTGIRISAGGLCVGVVALVRYAIWTDNFIDIRLCKR